MSDHDHRRSGARARARRLRGSSAWLLAVALAGCSETAPPSAAPPELQSGAAQAAQPDDGSARAAEEQPLDRERVRSLLARRDPSSDGWTSEVIGAELDSRLEGIQAARTLGSAAVARDLCAQTLRSSALRPALELAFEQDELRVWRAASQAHEAPTRAGVAAFAAALDDLFAPFEGLGDPQVAVKVIFVERDEAQPERVRTRAHVSISAGSAARSLSQHAQWTCDWQLAPDSEGDWRLAGVQVQHFEEVALARATPWLRDATLAVLGQTEAWEQQLRYGLDHWGRHVERLQQSNLYLKWGLCIGDVNGDGLEDLYLCQPGGLPNRLFVQARDGSVSDRSMPAGVDFLDASSAALLVDMDGDADCDLVVATQSGVVLLANDGVGRFSERARLALADIDLNSVNAVDYDLDGDLDLYVTASFASAATRRANAGARFDYVDANDGGRNVLWRNEGSLGAQWHFVDATLECGLDRNNRRYSLASTWVDYDSDGDADLYVANDYGQNCLYRNEGGHFVDLASEAGVVDFGSGMSASWGDYDRDGRLDLYVANMFSSAGRRVTTQRAFRPDDGGAHRELFGEFARGNSLFRQLEGGRFEELAATAGVELGRWAWGSLFCDLNGDGWEDLVVANGYVTTEDSGDS